MKIETIPYLEYIQSVPQAGRHILGQQTDEHILVYQAFNHNIANFALEHQHFGGPHYSYSRMTWIKPNFLWMMYRCGWAEKENQERILGIWIRKNDFDLILANCAFSSYQENIYPTREAWDFALSQKPARLQWDPDHDIYGNKLIRKAIQLGIKDDLLLQFGQEMIVEIIDMTAFVKAQKQKIDNKKIGDLFVPKEWTYTPKDTDLQLQIGLGA